MFKTLRSRLLLSNVVIIAALFGVAMALFWQINRPDVRYRPTLQQLTAVSLANRYQIRRLRDIGAGPDALQQVLAQTAADTGVRIVVASARSNQVLFDSEEVGSWVGETINVANRPQRFLADQERNTISGRFQHPDGSRWLVYSPPIPEFGQLRVFYIQREPTILAFFGEFFFSPLLGAGVVAFLLSVLLAIWIASSVARPLHQMADAAEAIAHGNYDQQLSIQGPGEVERLASSFNSMATQVHASQQAQRDFVANVSHDLKTPITSIQGWSQALLDGTAASTEEQRQAAGIIHSETNRMARMVAQLLDLAKIESGQLVLARELVDLGQILTDVRHSLMVQAQEQKIHLTMQLDTVPPIWGDHDRLMQIFTNLVDNALAHTPPEGQVHLSLRRHNAQAIEAVVQDTGSGIEPQDLSRIFERFYQIDRSRTRNGGRQGSGLGLAIVRELVEAHHGRIQARSQVGEGSAFIVRLPISDDPQVSTLISREL
jgi:two-component system OmpR family sensor kinase